MRLTEDKMPRQLKREQPDQTEKERKSPARSVQKDLALSPGDQEPNTLQKQCGRKVEATGQQRKSKNPHFDNAKSTPMPNSRATFLLIGLPQPSIHGTLSTRWTTDGLDFAEGFEEHLMWTTLANRTHHSFAVCGARRAHVR